MKTLVIAAALAALSLNVMAAEPAQAAKSANPPVTKEACVKKSKDGKKCLEKKQVPQPTRNPVAEKKKQQEAKKATVDKKKPVK